MINSTIPPNTKRPPKAKKRRLKPRRKMFKLSGSNITKRFTFEEYRQRVREHYDGPAGAVLKIASLTSLHEPLAARLFKSRNFDLSDCKRILDIGTGAGQLLRHIVKESEPDAEIVCTDLSQTMLRRAKNRVRNDRPISVACDITHIPFQDESFDCVTCGWVLEHLPDPVPGLSEVARVLRPGGKLLLLATEDTVFGSMTSYLWSCRTYNRKELKAACEDLGLNWCRQLYFTPVHRALKIGGILVELVKD